ncbi:MAG: PhaM family polyhydroxyalkanoate granule multifunctional regulatory protein [Burkholderiaceae bacterium]
MSNPAKPAWPDPGSLPFSLFGNAASPPASAGSSQAFGQPLAQGLAGGVDFMKKLWGNVPGNTAVPGFLLPTLDLDELDKRISDLKAAESWLEVNLNLLRATVQGLEVQRHTIAAIRSLGAVTEMPQAPKAASPAPLTPSGLPPGWPVAHAAEKANSAATGETRRVTETERVAPDDAEPQASNEGVKADDTKTIEELPAATKKTARESTRASASLTEAPTASPTSALAGLAANNWLGYMQDQFAKVAKAALASSEVARPHEGRAAPNRTLKPAAKRSSRSVPSPTPTPKPAAKRRAAAKKTRAAR